MIDLDPDETDAQLLAERDRLVGVLHGVGDRLELVLTPISRHEATRLGAEVKARSSPL